MDNQFGQEVTVVELINHGTIQSVRLEFDDGHTNMVYAEHRLALPMGLIGKKIQFFPDQEGDGNGWAWSPLEEIEGQEEVEQ